MATPEQINDLRRLVNDSTAPFAFDAPTLSGFLDAVDGDLHQAAGTVWSIKASQYAELVDTTEGSSSRKMSQLHGQALKMVEFYGGGSTTTTTTRTGRSGTRPIVRP